MQKALEISIKISKNIKLKMTVQNANLGTIILIGVLVTGILVGVDLFFDFKREERTFKREQLKMEEMTQNRIQEKKDRGIKKNALEISIKIGKNIKLKMTIQNADVGTIILISVLGIAILVGVDLFFDFKREERIFKREQLKMEEMTQNRIQEKKDRGIKKSERKKRKKG